MLPLNILLAYQLENYKNVRFLKFIYTHPKFWISGSQRQKLEYTSKAKLILILGLIFMCIEILGSIYFLSWISRVWAIIIIFLAMPLYFVVASVILKPLDRYLKNRIIKQAKNKIALYPNLKIIGITGSMWKTTTKEFLHTILKEKYNVLATQGTKNTPLGISRVILSELSDKHEIFIVEMWAYEKWNIAELCNIATPNISIITGITLQHLERFWSLQDIIDTKFEIFEALTDNWLAIIDTSTKWAQKWLSEKSFATKNIITVSKWLNYSYKDNLWWIEFKLEWNTINTKILSNYIVETLQICWEVSKNLWMTIQEFQNRVGKIDFVEHRMQLIHNTTWNVYVIDDSFNGNIEWVKSIVHLLKNAPFAGRKILIAGWVVELWDQSDIVNISLWEEIASGADMVLLVEWPIGNAIAKWLKNAQYKESNIKIYSNPLSLHQDLKNITQNGDMIIFQNDLPDTYL